MKTKTEIIYKKLIYSWDVKQEFEMFFGELFKVKEVGTLATTIDRKDIFLCPCPYDGMALNRADGSIYLKFVNKNGDEFLLLEGQIIIIDDQSDFYITTDVGLVTISKNNIHNELKRLKEHVY